MPRNARPAPTPTGDPPIFRLLPDGTEVPDGDPAPGAFLRGPVPMRWLREADGVSHTALMLSLLLCHIAGCAGSRTVRVRFANPDFKGRSRWSWNRALRALERAKLVRVQREGRCIPVVTLLFETRGTSV